MLGNATKGWVLDMVGDQAEYEQRLKAVETKANKNTEDIASNKEDIETNSANIETNTEAISTINSDLEELNSPLFSVENVNLINGVTKLGDYSLSQGDTVRIYIKTVSGASGYFILEADQNYTSLGKGGNLADFVNGNFIEFTTTSSCNAIYFHSAVASTLEVFEVLKPDTLKGQIATINNNVNTINSELSNLTSYTYVTNNGITWKFWKVSNLIFLQASGTLTDTAWQYSTMATIPSGYRPAHGIDVFIGDVDIFIDSSSGIISNQAQLNAGTSIDIWIPYLG